jgi:hypothetical protein
MSRTDKDRPAWLRSTWWEPDHYRCQHSWLARGSGRTTRDCDLPERPVLERPVRATWRTTSRTCSWVPCHDYYYGYQPGGVPTWYVRLEFTGPDRRRVRDELTRARQEHRATGEVDAVPSTTQHRHMARWSWW